MPYQKKVRKANDCKQTCVNWAELDPDMLRNISRKLCDIASFIMFRAVCKRWRSVTNLSDCPRQFPCLIDWLNGRGTTLRVYSPASRRTHIFEVPNAFCWGPSGGDMLIQSKSNVLMHLSYLNPLTRVEQNLPFEVPLSRFELTHVSLNSRIDEFAVVKEGVYDVLYFKLSENDRWAQKNCRWLRTVAYYDRRYFLLEAICLYCRIVVIDKTNGAELPSVAFPRSDSPFKYLIATPDGLLAITAFIPVYAKDLKNSRFEVHQLENYPQNPHWTKLNGIGDLILFLDHLNGFSLRASEYNGVKGNCIYFITRCRKPMRGTKHVIGRLDMGLNKIEDLSGPTWFGKRNSIMNAAWFMPSM